jgi:hypothetical protein
MPERQVLVRLDRIQLVCIAPRDDRPPKRIDGFKRVKDSFVRRQTTESTYARRSEYRSLTNEAAVFWQYRKQRPWLPPWKVTIVADDKAGLSCKEIGRILAHCNSYRILTVEIALDFDPARVNRGFIRRHAVFGKSRRRRSVLRKQKK